jgi:hypothetical protein
MAVNQTEGGAAPAGPIPQASGGQPEITPEQRAYARVLTVGVRVAAAVLAVTFATYACGLLAPHLPIGDLPKHWGSDAREFTKHTGGATGWGWAARLDSADYLCFVGVAVLAGLSVIAYARITPVLLRKRDWVYLGIVLAQIAVLGLAASGLLVSGGH